MAKKKGPGVASMHPDNMVSAGLADDFDGTITEARLVKWDYDGKGDEGFFGRLTIQPDDGQDVDEEVINYYSAGKLEYFAPTEDGETESDEGVMALRTGKSQQMSKSTNWAFFLATALEAEFPEDKFDSDVRFLEGARFHFNRVPQPKRGGGIASEDDEGRKYEALVGTQFLGFASESKGKGGSKKSSAVDLELDGALEELVIEALTDADDSTLLTKKLPTLAAKGDFTGAQKAKAVKRVVDKSFLGADGAPWEYDPKKGTISLG